MHQHCQEALGVLLLRLPMAMAEDAVAIRGIDFNRLCDCSQAKRRPGKKVAYDGLNVAVREPGMGLKRSKPRREPLGSLCR
jgi:hypothetical protein